MVNRTVWFALWLPPSTDWEQRPYCKARVWNVSETTRCVSRGRHVCIEVGVSRIPASAHKLAEEFLLVHVVLEGLASVDEDHRDFVVELATKFRVHIDVDFLPRKAAAAREFGQALFHHFAKMTSLAGIDHNVARLWHAGEILARRNRIFPAARKKEDAEGLVAGPVDEVRVFWSRDERNLM